MKELLDEIEEDIREENFQQMLKTLTPYIIGAFLTILFITLLYVGYDYYRASRNEKLGDRFVSAVKLMNQGQDEEGLNSLKDLREEGGTTISSLAGLLEASEYVRLNRQEEAAETLVLMKNNSEVILNELAKFQHVSLRMQGGVYDQATLAELEQIIEKGNPFRGSGLILLALYNYKVGKNLDALQNLEMIMQDELVSLVVKSKAQALKAAFSS